MVVRGDHAQQPRHDMPRTTPQYGGRRARAPPSTASSRFSSQHTPHLRPAAPITPKPSGTAQGREGRRRARPATWDPAAASSPPERETPPGQLLAATAAGNASWAAGVTYLGGAARLRH